MPGSRLMKARLSHRRLGAGPAPCVHRAGAQRHRHACARSALGRGVRYPYRAHGARRRVVRLTAVVARGSRADGCERHIRDSQASIHFGAAQAETRALIEASIPRLREMLAAQGFQLADASVSQGFARQPRGDTPARTRRGRARRRAANRGARDSFRPVRPVRLENKLGTFLICRCSRSARPLYRSQSDSLAPKNRREPAGLCDASHVPAVARALHNSSQLNESFGRGMSAWRRKMSR